MKRYQFYVSIEIDDEAPDIDPSEVRYTLKDYFDDWSTEAVIEVRG